MSTPDHNNPPSKRVLTKRQATALQLITDHQAEGDTVDEEHIVNELWPTIIRVRHITNSLVRKGLIRYGAYHDERGYELKATPAGMGLYHRDAT